MNFSVVSTWRPWCFFQWETQGAVALWGCWGRVAGGQLGQWVLGRRKGKLRHSTPQWWAGQGDRSRHQGVEDGDWDCKQVSSSFLPSARTFSSFPPCNGKRPCGDTEGMAWAAWASWHSCLTWVIREVKAPLPTSSPLRGLRLLLCRKCLFSQ